MTTRVFIPRDTAARSVGADGVATSLAIHARDRSLDVTIVRNGSRGLLWLEPLVEVETDAGRIAYGPVAPGDIPGLLDAGFLTGGEHPLRHGPTDEIPYLARQERRMFARVGRHRSAVGRRSPGARRPGGARSEALAMAPKDVVAQVTASGLRGRGGAGFPTGIKWQTVLDTPGELKFICCNADEGDSGTYADRMLMEGDPFLLIEGMVIAAHAVGATEGFIYIRSEYPAAVETMRAAILAAERDGWLGAGILGTDLRFDAPGPGRVPARTSAAKRPRCSKASKASAARSARSRHCPPSRACSASRPSSTTSCRWRPSRTSWPTAPRRTRRSGSAGRAGPRSSSSAATSPTAASWSCRSGVTLRHAGRGRSVAGPGPGARSGPSRWAVRSAPICPTSQFDLPMDYEAFAEAGAMIGHGGIVVFDETVDMAKQARFAMEFCAEESCGKCTPCRVGSVRGVEVIDRIIRNEDRYANLTLLEDLCEVMTDGSLCAMGGLTPMPVRSAVRHFGEDFERPVAAPTSGGQA